MKSLAIVPREPLPLSLFEPESSARRALEHLRARQSNLLLFLLHGSACPDCAGLARQIEENRSGWLAWDTESLTLSAEEVPKTAERLRRRLGAPEGSVVIAALEQRGGVMDAWALIHPGVVEWEELAETARWLGIQEPECGTCEIAPGWEMAQQGLSEQ